VLEFGYTVKSVEDTRYKAPHNKSHDTDIVECISNALEMHSTISVSWDLLWGALYLVSSTDFTVYPNSVQPQVNGLKWCDRLRTCQGRRQPPRRNRKKRGYQNLLWGALYLVSSTDFTVYPNSSTDTGP
jgi:hypothetical protein